MQFCVITDELVLFSYYPIAFRSALRAASVLLKLGFAYMANISWKLTTGGDWESAANWSSGSLPGSADAVTISTVSAATVTHADGSESVSKFMRAEPTGGS